MTLSHAAQEFRLRKYPWAKTEWEKEVNASFPHLRLFKTGLPWDTYQFMQKLNKEDQCGFGYGTRKTRQSRDRIKMG